MKSLNIFTFLLILFIIACKTNTQQPEKYQKHRNNIVSVQNKIIDIKPEIIFGKSWLYIIDDILIVAEQRAYNEKGIHLFNKNTFKYITSTAIIGKGPNEVAALGTIGIDSKNKILWVTDNGKKLRWKFPLDSILNNEMYKPTEKLNLYDDLYLSRYGFLNDSIVLGKAMRVLNIGGFDMAMAKLNINTNVTEVYGYEHPEVYGKRTNSFFALSVKNNFYVNCFAFCDLMTICDLDGNLKYNIYGKKWFNKERKNIYFDGVDLFDKYIIASYVGDERIVYDEHKRPKENCSSKLMIFNLKGDYIKTIDTEYEIISFCIDEENDRLIAYFDGRENPLGYFNLNLD